MIASYLLRLDGVCCTDSSRFDWTRTAVTASTPLMVSEDIRDSVAAVVGLQMTYRTFYEFFANATSVCPRDLATSSSAAANCNLTCASLVTPFSHSRSVSLSLCLPVCVTDGLSVVFTDQYSYGTSRCLWFCWFLIRLLYSCVTTFVRLTEWNEAIDIRVNSNTF